MKNSLFLILLSLLVNIIAVNVDGRIIRKRNRKNVMNMNHPYSKYPSNNPWNKKPSYPSNNPWNKKPSYPSNNPWNKKPSFPSNNPWMHNWNKTHDAETPHTEPETPHTEPETPHTEPACDTTVHAGCLCKTNNYPYCNACCRVAYDHEAEASYQACEYACRKKFPGGDR